MSLAQAKVARDVTRYIRVPGYHYMAGIAAAVGVGYGDRIGSRLRCNNTTGACSGVPQIRNTTGRRTKQRGFSPADRGIACDGAERHICLRDRYTTGTATAICIGDGNTIISRKTCDNTTGCRSGTPPIRRTTGRRTKQRGLSAARQGAIAGDFTMRRQAGRNDSAANTATAVCIRYCNTVVSRRINNDTTGCCTGAPPIRGTARRRTK